MIFSHSHFNNATVINLDRTIAAWRQYDWIYVYHFLSPIRRCAVHATLAENRRLILPICRLSVNITDPFVSMVSCNIIGALCCR